MRGGSEPTKKYSGDADKTKKPRVTASRLGISFSCSHRVLIGENTFRPGGKTSEKETGANPVGYAASRERRDGCTEAGT